MNSRDLEISFTARLAWEPLKMSYWFSADLLEGDVFNIPMKDVCLWVSQIVMQVLKTL